MKGEVKNRKEPAMKKSDVKIGATYVAKVSDRLAEVRITGESPHGGWDGVNIATKRKVRIKSAQRLRGKSSTRLGGKRTATKAKPESDVAKTRDAVDKGGPAQGATVPAAANKATKDPKAAAKRDTGEQGAKGAKQTSGLDAAARVLAEAGEPLNCKAIVECALAKGYWKTSGRTPAATIYAAIAREIQKKGDEARFRKTERGKFALNK